LNEDKAARYHRLKRRAAVLTVALNATLLALVLESGASAWLRDLAMHAAGAGSDAPATVAIFVVLLAVTQSAVSLPLTFYDGFLLEQRYGLSSESRGDFIRDHLKAALVNIGFALAGAEVVYAAMRAWPRAWWLASSSAIACGIALLAGLAPVVLLPLFYRFRPLDRDDLQERLTALSHRAGVRVLGVYEWGLGAKTRRANAALVGSGRTRRVLVSDTLLAEYSDDEIEVILAHELGHHAHRDMLKALLVEAALIVSALGLSALALHLLWRPLALVRPSDVAGLPLLILAAGALMLCATPILNLLSRHHERRADHYALELTARPAAFVSAMRRLGTQNLAETNPSRLALWLFHSHPPVEQRISAAREFSRDGNTG
jgi:Zn-dependent protease with chaperone function